MYMAIHNTAYPAKARIFKKVHCFCFFLVTNKLGEIESWLLETYLRVKLLVTLSENNQARPNAATM